MLDQAKGIQIGNFRVRIDRHSINPVGKEAITFDLCCERQIWAEVMTHRWCRNASSSRAIPYQRMKEWILKDPALPVHLGTNKPGMQSGSEVKAPDKCREDLKSLLRYVLCRFDQVMEEHDLHKEIINRYTEPWGWINSVHTMGREQLMNAFHLRCNKGAHPNAQRLFVNMARLYRESVPTPLKPGEWHLPFLYPDEENLPIHTRLVWSVARCAWCSYRTVQGKVGIWENALKRHNDCVAYPHSTPLEHQLECRNDDGRNGGPVAGYNQYRHMIPNESRSEFDFSILDTVYSDRDFVV